MNETNFSRKTYAMADTYGITPREMAFADLVAAGWQKADAFILAMGVGNTWTPYALTQESTKLAGKLAVKRRIRELKKDNVNETAKSVSDNQEEDVFKALSKENMLRDLYLARKKMTPGSKDWLDTNKMIADITRMKQDEIKTEDNTVHFYLPLTCNHCALYLANDKE